MTTQTNDQDAAELADFLGSLKTEIGIRQHPYFGIIYGPSGVGKSWLAACAEKPFFIPTEQGAMMVPGVPRFNAIPKTFDQLMGVMRALCNKKWRTENLIDSDGNPLDIKTFVIDGMSFIEPLIHAKVVKDNPTIRRNGSDFAVTSVADYDYGDGYAKSDEHWLKLRTAINVLRDKGFNVIAICHSHYRNVNDENGTYKFIDLSMKVFGSSNPPEIFKREADWGYLMTSEVETNKLTENRQDKRRIGSDLEVRRVVKTHTTSLFWAKARIVNGDAIPSEYTLDKNGEVAKQIFLDLQQ